MEYDGPSGNLVLKLYAPGPGLSKFCNFDLVEVPIFQVGCFVKKLLGWYFPGPGVISWSDLFNSFFFAFPNP